MDLVSPTAVQVLQGQGFSYTHFPVLKGLADSTEMFQEYILTSLLSYLSFKISLGLTFLICKMQELSQSKITF